MAIVNMNRVSILLMRKDEKAFLRLAQRCGCVHLVQAQQPQAEEAPARDGMETARQQELSRIRWTISKLSRYDREKRSMLSPLPQVPLAELERDQYPAAMAAVEETEKLERLSGELRGQETRLRLMISQLTPWLQLDIPADKLTSTRSTRVFTGYLKTAELGRIQDEWAGRAVAIKPLSSQRDLQYIIAWAHVSEAEEFQSALRSSGFQQATPGEGSGTPAAQKDALQGELERVLQSIAGIDGQMETLGEALPQLRLCFEALSADTARADAVELMAHTQSVSLMEGWIPASLTGAFEKEVKSAFPHAQIAFREAEEGEEPPVLLGNKPLIAPYETIVAGFALPDPSGIDPTNLMMPFFVCFFGMMVSDAGYGLMMAILIPILIKIMQPGVGLRKLMLVLFGGGIATVFWGALYNTWFGFAAIPALGLFDAVNNSMPVMALCIGLGAVHLFAGLGMGAYVNIRDKKPLDAVYDQLSWVLLIVGLGLLALPQTAAVGKWMAITGAAIVVLTAGRNKTKNPIKRVISGLGALYGVTGWISDLLSYMRLFGMGLATGVIGMVINQLVGMMTAGGGIISLILGAVVFVGAHLFNAAINILGAYVHACRLQYIEFFGKFYSEGGKPFKPLRFSPRHVRVRDVS